MARKDKIQKTFTYDGKRHYVRGKNAKEAEINREVLRAELESGKRTISRNMTVSDWCEEWLETYKEGIVNDRHYQDLKMIVNNYIVPEVGHAKISKVKPVQLQKILNGLTHLSTSYIRKIYQVIKGVFHTAYINDLTLDDVSKALFCPQGKKKVDRRPITREERELTLRTAQWSRGGTFVMIMLYCGLRPGEVAALKWTDIDLQQNLIHVDKALKANDTIGDPKSKAGVRTVPIPDPLHNHLASIDHEPFGLVCTNKSGNQLTKTTMTKLWKEFKHDMEYELNGSREIKMPLADDLTMYCYRHTYGTDLQAAGVPINVAKELMGHSSISITAQIYTHKSDEAFRNAAALIDRYQATRN